MLDYQGTGMSVMEMSHRSAAFKGIIETAEQDIRDLMNIPDNYRVLFLQGGATQQFAAIPMNLMQNKVADYIVSGNWSKKAFKEAKLYGDSRSAPMPITFTSARTRPSTATVTPSCPKPATSRWSPTCRACSSPNPWTCRSTA